MTVQEAAKHVMGIRGYSQAKVAEKAGLPGQSTVGMFLKSKSMRVENLLKILDACEFNLVIEDRHDRSRRFVIGDGDSDVADGRDEELRDMVRQLIREEMGSEK